MNTATRHFNLSARVTRLEQCARLLTLAMAGLSIVVLAAIAGGAL